MTGLVSIKAGNIFITFVFISVDCEWNFFATSHGKLPCDGIGGSMKRVTARASLQKTTSGHILTAEQMFKFCKEAIPSVNFVYFTANEINTAYSKLEHQYSITKTIPGTRSLFFFFLKTYAGYHKHIFW